jgi:cyclopropane-fatty-acyl-phospholipid synthase
MSIKIDAGRAVLRAILSRVRGGEIEVIDRHGIHTFGRQPEGVEPLRARLVIHDEQTYVRMLRTSVGLGSSYMDGMWDCDDLVTLLRIAARDASRFDRLRAHLGPLARAPHLLAERLQRNTVDGSRQNIARHYDLGNDLFGLILDETMTYSSAVYEHPGMSLRDAQLAKLDLIARKLDLQPDDHLLEIGTGWGALAIHLARRYGCRVTTTTISTEQHALAVERVRQAGLEDQIILLLEDYRALTGVYDKVVSVEMIEAVGWQYFDTYFERLRSLVRDGGLMLLQAITIDSTAYEVEKNTPSFINTYIFPGGCLPSIDVIQDCAARAGLRPVLLEDITAHYVTTLHEWRARFLAATDQLDALGYDERFRRTFDLYLAYCEAGFTERRIQDIQVVLAGPRHRADPCVAIAPRRAVATLTS